MTVVSMSYLLEAGVHFGHQKRRWNPKMKEYIYTSRDDIYIIDLQKTVKQIEEAYEALKKIAEKGGTVLYVGTKKQAVEAMEENANRTNMFFVNERWLGGTLTNFRTIRNRIKRLDEIEQMEEDGIFEVLPKKEVAKIKKEYEKLNRNLRGIRNMKRLLATLLVAGMALSIASCGNKDSEPVIEKTEETTVTTAETKPQGWEGTYQSACTVHSRKVCARCGSEIHVKTIGGRSSYYCPHCQK